ncbi:glycerate kinase [Gynuella sunshinyii]|uniref:Glycerate kinase n=1 Tax=Gynuella sunshinyii YC6258 TaxID=1445510 RepID=A0A0C5VB33_9GAMM|nr:glycerate kinase [Gynuella sunshinyii]AJQ96555.1 glycerate kinase [Gynuella sunshinyii YC6258]
MKIAIAPDSFKESMTAGEACATFAEGWLSQRSQDEFIFLPLADGGEGTTVAICNAVNGVIQHKKVRGPLDQEVNGFIGLWNNRHNAVIEIAAASGLDLLKRDERNPLLATSYGTGELIRYALDQGIKELVIGLGGSATNDGGAGLLQALGVQLLDKNDQQLPPGGIHLRDLARIDLSTLDPRIHDIHIQVASDVTNPLLGQNGASAVFGPQKGATPEQVVMLDQALERYVTVLEQTIGRQIRHLPGTGAAGGAGTALLSVLNAEFKAGIDLILDLMEFDRKISDCDLVVTGEGSLDYQSLMGKTPQGVLRRAVAANIPVIAVAGSITNNLEPLYDAGFTAVFGITQAVQTLEKAMQDGKTNMINCARNLARWWTLAHDTGKS